MHTRAMETVDDELTGELVDLTRQLRAQLERHAAHGAWAAPGGASERAAPGHEAPDDAAAGEGDADAVPQLAAFADDAPRIALVDRADTPVPIVERRSLPQIRAELGE